MDSEERQKKILMMKIGVGAIIILIFFLWVFNMKNLWRPIVVSNDNLQTQSPELNKFKNDINSQMTEINKRLNDITNQKQAATNKAGDELLNNVIKGTVKATSSPDISTSSPINTSTTPVINSSSSVKIKNSKCPAYINCMPTIGAAKPCQIPAGCEGITQIAY